MEELTSYLQNKRNIINLLVFGILLLALPLGIQLVRQQQILKSFAREATVAFLPGECVKTRGNNQVAICKDGITVSLVSPYGPPQSITPQSVQSVDNGLIGTVYADDCPEDDPDCHEPPPPPPCVSDGSCSAGEPACEQTTYGEDNCGNECDRTGPACGYQCNESTNCSGSGNYYCYGAETYICDKGCVENSCREDFCHSVDGNPLNCGGGGGVCTAGAFGLTCTGSCGGCSSDAGEAYIYQCRTDESGWDILRTECRTECVGQCSGGSCPGDSACGAYWGTGASCSSSSGVARGDGCYGGTGHVEAKKYGCSGTICREAANGQYSSSSCDGKCTSITTGACTETNFTDKCGTSKTYTGACQELRNAGSSIVCNTASCTSIKTDYNNTVQCGGTGNLNMTVNPASGVAGSQYSVDLTGACGGGCDIGVDLTAPTGCTSQGIRGCPNYIWRYNCIAPASGTVNISGKNGCNKVATSTFTVNSSTSPSPSPSASPVITVYTTHYKVAEKRPDLAGAAWIPYTIDPMEHTFNFTDSNLGQKSVWVQFKSSSNQESTPIEKKINFVGADPQISSSLDCNLETNNVISFKVKGVNFGRSKGNSRLTANSSNITVDEWSDTEITGKLAGTGATGTQKFDVTLTRGDGAPATTQSCSLGIAQISLGAKLFCHLPNKHAATNVRVSIAEEATGSATASAKPVREVVTIDTHGLLQGLRTKVQEGKQYKLAIKVPGGLRKTVEFTAASGTTVVPNLTLPVGDIFPVGGGDGKIDAFDLSALFRQWTLGASGAGRDSDFNGDNRVNSIDYACMREHFGQSDASDL